MSQNPYVPGKAIVLSRLPAQDWFTVEEAARYSGWGRTYVVERIAAGKLPAQEGTSSSPRRIGRNRTYRIHVDDLVLFILLNSRGKYTEERPFRDVVAIIRPWPAWMQRELIKVLNRLVPVPATGTGQAAVPTASASDSGTGETQS